MKKTVTAPAQTRKWTFKRFLTTSLILHAIAFVFVVFTPKDFFEIKKPDVVQIDFVEKQQTADTRKTKPAPKVEKQQVVDQDQKALNDELAPDTKYLSAHNQVVKKQTVAAHHGEFKNLKTRSDNASEGGKNTFKPITTSDARPQFDVVKLVEDRLKAEKERESKSEEDAIKIFEEKKKKADEIAKNETAKNPSQNSAPAGDKTKGDSGAQASQTIDYIKDLDQGMETMLSTKEFVYYTYYARIRRQLNQYWGPKVREKIAKIYKQGRSIASNEDKVTKLLITLDQKGYLLRVQVIGDSGVHDLDEAAVEAFRAAAPFPNPPNGMIDPDGQIKLRWDFILEA